MVGAFSFFPYVILGVSPRLTNGQLFHCRGRGADHGSLENTGATSDWIARSRRRLHRGYAVLIQNLQKPFVGIEAIERAHIRGIRIGRIVLVLIGGNVEGARDSGGRVCVNQAGRDENKIRAKLAKTNTPETPPWKSTPRAHAQRERFVD